MESGPSSPSPLEHCTAAESGVTLDLCRQAKEEGNSLKRHPQLHTHVARAGKLLGQTDSGSILVSKLGRISLGECFPGISTGTQIFMITYGLEYNTVFYDNFSIRK